MRLLVVTILALLVASPVRAHRLDEYLQDTNFLVKKNHLVGWIRLTPGVQVFPAILAVIDTDGDGTISESEQDAYAKWVLSDLSLSLDGQPLTLRLVSRSFPKIDRMKEGLADILIEFNASFPAKPGNRRLTYENHHRPQISAYLVNSLVPDDPDIRITAQNRNYDQSAYELDYAQAGSIAAVPAPVASVYPGWEIAIGGGITLVMLAVLAGRQIRQRL